MEVDGSVHSKIEVKEKDEIRQKDLEQWGYTVIRFTNKQVMQQPEDVIKSIIEKVMGLSKTNSKPGK